REMRAVCDGLSDATHETANAAILDGGYAVTITQSAGREMAGVEGQQVGQRAPRDAISTGELLLGEASDRTVEQVASESLSRCTDATCTDIAQLAEESALIRHRGSSSAVGEWEDGINALAAPVYDATGVLVAVVSVTAPDFRMPEAGFDEFLGHLRVAARDFQARLGFSPIDPTAP